jgi:hypothetical protein
MGGIVSHKTMLLRVAGDGASYRVKITVGVGRPMSALGQKQTSNRRLKLSTSKGALQIAGYRCPLCPQKRTSFGTVAMSALCQ